MEKEYDSLTKINNKIQKSLGSQFAFGSSLNNDVLKSVRKNHVALTSITGLTESIKASQLAFGSSLNNAVLKSVRKNHETLTMVLGSVSAASLDFGKNINTLVKTGAIETIKDSMQQASRLGLPVVSFQTKLAQTVQSGIPEEFIENLNHISNLSITNYEMLLDENEVTLFEHQLEQNITEINQELRDNPDGIWVKLNSWATEILEAPTALKEKYPEIILKFLYWKM